MKCTNLDRRPESKEATHQYHYKFVWTAGIMENYRLWKAILAPWSKHTIELLPTYLVNHSGFGTRIHRLALSNTNPTFKKYLPKRFSMATNGLNVPGLPLWHGDPMGVIQYSFGVLPVRRAWLGQHFYLHWAIPWIAVFLKKWPLSLIKDVSYSFWAHVVLRAVNIWAHSSPPYVPVPEIPTVTREALRLVIWQFWTFALI